MPADPTAIPLGPDGTPAPLDVIAVGAHPDDVEIACGGTLATLADQGYRVGIVDLTDGEPTPRTNNRRQRLDEAAAAARTLGVVRQILDLPNRRLFDTFEARCELAKCFRRHRPKVVLGIAGKTPMASPDHWQASQITDAAVFYSRLTKWGEHFEDLDVHTVDRQVWFPLGFSTAAVPPHGGQFTADITAAYDRKIAAVRCYESQFPPEKQRVFRGMDGLSLMLGAAAGFERGEAFLASTAIGTADFMGTVLSGSKPPTKL